MTVLTEERAWRQIEPKGRGVEGERRELDELRDLLAAAYRMEIETVMSYLAAATNLRGVRGRNVAESLRGDVLDELGHAERFARRLNQLGGVVPGSLEPAAELDSTPRGAEKPDVACVIEGVLDAEGAAIAHCRRIIEASQGLDHVTQDLAIKVLADEEAHRRVFQAFAREYVLEQT